MIVTYLDHSGYMFEFDQCVLLFDFVKGELPQVSKEKPWYVFVSHHHEDHYHKRIFELREMYTSVTYIFSDDIQTDELVQFMKADELRQLGMISIQTLRSTDEGVAYIVEVNKQSIYFAGDLNWWDWGSEDTLDEALIMEQAYRKELEKIKEKHINIACLPVDPRLAQRATKGALTFLDYVQVEHLFCMHMWGNYEIQTALFDCINKQSPIDCHKILAGNQSFII